MRAAEPTARKPPASRSRARRAAAWTALALALAVTFAAYLNPHLAVALADQIRGCF